MMGCSHELPPEGTGGANPALDGSTGRQLCFPPPTASEPIRTCSLLTLQESPQPPARAPLPQDTLTSQKGYFPLPWAASPSQGALLLSPRCRVVRPGSPGTYLEAQTALAPLSGQVHRQSQERLGGQVCPLSLSHLQQRIPQ